VKFDPFFEAKHPPLALVLPRLSENADIIFAFIIVFNQRLMICCQLP
jgi:hypothetical protein